MSSYQKHKCAYFYIFPICHGNDHSHDRLTIHTHTHTSIHYTTSKPYFLKSLGSVDMNRCMISELKQYIEKDGEQCKINPYTRTQTMSITVYSSFCPNFSGVDWRIGIA
ncbi:unnamed protein product [Cuscuta europaea]|uniref:Uncharacterized protein n=1 Tax=Cuscuta europaea TaxID=41803 RepID=A0A9P0YL58_CUSEU|nr:unnamed protein product [Cuscuta europaea]